VLDERSRGEYNEVAARIDIGCHLEDNNVVDALSSHVSMSSWCPGGSMV
jgi:hypothetical protein